jgi:hypothetical protein
MLSISCFRFHAFDFMNENPLWVEEVVKPVHLRCGSPLSTSLFLCRASLLAPLRGRMKNA